MANVQELRELDREWEELAGERQKWESDGTMISITVNCGPSPRYSSRAFDCFGAGGPWEWLVAQPLHYDLTISRVTNGTNIYCCGGGLTDYFKGATIFEAITRCAIEARKKLSTQHSALSTEVVA